MTLGRAFKQVCDHAGATYPYGKDPLDRNIRIAPTFPALEELEQAIDIFTLCVQLVSIEKLLSEKSQSAPTA
ncbi:aminotransferase [Bacillus safensis FO-36b] [Bacillus safensis subsp. safensis]